MAITTVHNELIAVNAISGTAIADNAVTSVHIAKNNVGTVQIAQNSVTSVSIALNNVTGTQIAMNSITSTQLADNAVTATKIPDGTQLALGATTFSDDVIINNSSPELYFGTTGNHYNWRLAAQENVDAAFTIDVGSQDTAYGDDTYNSVFTVKNTGNVGIGINPATTLHLDASGGAVMRLQRTSANASNKLELSHDGTNASITSTNNLGINATHTTFDGLSNYNGIEVKGSGGSRPMIQWSNANNGDLCAIYGTEGNAMVLTSGSSNTAAITIDSSQRVLIGNTSNAAHQNFDDLQIGNGSGSRGITVYSGTGEYGSVSFADGNSGTAQYSGLLEYLHTDNSMRLYTSGTERMRILSDGTFCVGTTHSAVDNTNGVFIQQGGNVYCNIAANTSSYHLRHDYNWRFYVTHLGVVNAQTTSISAISDERLKENIKDLETGLNEVLALKPRRFDWVEDEKVPTKNIAGFIAQEVETVLPDLIGSYEHDRIKEAKSLRMGDMIPTLVKAIQEQQEQIETLKKEVDKLKG